MVLFEQFRVFLNFYFLMVALSQFIPALKIGFLFTYIAPLVFVLSVTMIKELYDEIKRFLRDKEVNGQKFSVLTPNGVQRINASAIQVGHLVMLNTNERAPADLLVLRTTEKSGASFIRTDQLVSMWCRSLSL